MSRYIGTRYETLRDTCFRNVAITLTPNLAVYIEQKIVVPPRKFRGFSNLQKEGIHNTLEPTNKNQVKDLTRTGAEDTTIVVHPKPYGIEGIDQELL